jgi:hypothetical protein
MSPEFPEFQEEVELCIVSPEFHKIPYLLDIKRIFSESH